MTLSELKQHNPQWFERGNKKFFGDVSYRVLHDKEHNAFLVRSTYQWSEAFGLPKILRWRVNPISPDYKIMPLLDRSFTSLESVKEYLKG